MERSEKSGMRRGEKRGRMWWEDIIQYYKMLIIHDRYMCMTDKNKKYRE